MIRVSTLAGLSGWGAERVGTRYVRKPTLRGAEMYEHRLPHSAKAAPIARRLAEQVAARLIPPGRIHDFVLMVSEAVSNAVLHAPAVADGSIRLRFETDGRTLRGVVTDGGRRFAPDAREARGREPSLHLGLKLIDELSSRWGITPLDGLKTVWFEVETASA
jgi:anti-sigma regulatory factor (Ser/Thr protein kinase)